MTKRTTPDELLGPTVASFVSAMRTLIAETLREVLDEYDLDSSSNRPEYIDQQALCVQLNTSLPTLRKLIDEGLPHVMVGDHRRFRMEDVRAWLNERTKGKP